MIKLDTKSSSGLPYTGPSKWDKSQMKAANASAR